MGYKNNYLYQNFQTFKAENYRKKIFFTVYSKIKCYNCEK